MADGKKNDLKGKVYYDGNAATGSGAPVTADSPTLSGAVLVAPVLGTPASGDLSNCTNAGVSTVTVTSYTSGSGTYTTPAGAVFIDVLCIGGGGGGANTSNGGGGGGAGGRVQKIITSPSATYVYTVGTGGAGAAASTTADGSDGVDTSFGAALLVAGGGKGGLSTGSGTNKRGGAGGSASGGDINEPGQAGSSAGYLVGGAGGGPGGGYGVHGSDGVDGQAGAANTGGGGGGTGGTNAQAAGAGGSGFILVKAYS